MYGLPRHYDVFDTHLDTRTKKQAHQPKPLHYLTVSQRRGYAEEVRGVIRDLQDEDLKGKRERSLSAYRANERALRQLAAQDMVLFLQAKRRLAELQYSRGAPDSGWSLRTLEATLLNTPIHYALPVPDTGRVLFHPECKIRDRGELSLLVRDRRLPSLLAYYPEQETTLHHAEIRAELASYRRARVRAMELVHELERRIVACLGAVAVRPKEEREATKPLLGEARHGDLLSALHTAQQAAGRPLAGGFADECFLRTRELRNAFAHNLYPTATMFEDIPRAIAGEAVPANPANHRKVAQKLVGRLEALYKPWLDFLASTGKGSRR